MSLGVRLGMRRREAYVIDVHDSTNIKSSAVADIHTGSYAIRGASAKQLSVWRPLLSLFE